MISEKKIKEAAADFLVKNYTEWENKLTPTGHEGRIIATCSEEGFIAGVQWAMDQLKFIKPSFEEVRAEVIYRGGTYELAESFWNHYESNNWMVGKVKMKKWTAAVSQWCARNKKNDPSNFQKNIELYNRI